MARSVPLQPGEKLYRIGVNDDCPVHHIYAGGQCFPRYSEKVSGYGSETQRDRMKGAIVRMGEGQLGRCIKEASNKVVRATQGRKSRARIHDTRTRNYRVFPNDKPVLGFMYALPLDSVENPYAEVSYPSLAETGGELTDETKEAAKGVQKAAAGHVDAASTPRRRRPTKRTQDSLG